MAPLAAKTISGLAVTTVLTIGTSTIYTSLVPATIGEELSSKGFKLLADENKWSKLDKKHASNDSKVPPKISSVSSSGTVKEKCQELWGSLLNTENKDKKIEDAKNWCIEDSEAQKKLSKKWR